MTHIKNLLNRGVDGLPDERIRWITADLYEDLYGAQLRVRLYTANPRRGGELVGNVAGADIRQDDGDADFTVWQDTALEVLDDVRRELGQEVALMVGSAAIASIAGVPVQE